MANESRPLSDPENCTNLVSIIPGDGSRTTENGLIWNIFFSQIAAWARSYDPIQPNTLRTKLRGELGLIGLHRTVGGEVLDLFRLPSRAGLEALRHYVICRLQLNRRLNHFRARFLHLNRDWKEPGGVDGNSAYMVR